MRLSRAGGQGDEGGEGVGRDGEGGKGAGAVLSVIALGWWAGVERGRRRGGDGKGRQGSQARGRKREGEGNELVGVEGGARLDCAWRNDPDSSMAKRQNQGRQPTPLCSS